jgi:hypothetical protein
MNDRDRKALIALMEKRNAELEAVGPTAAKRLARARLINSGMARYAENGEFVWMPEYGGPSIA